MSYMRTPIHSITFKNKRIREWVESNCGEYVLNLFSGDTILSINEYRNDSDNYRKADSHLDALEFCMTWKGGLFDTVILDPPYSYRKSMEYYNDNVSSRFRKVKDCLVDMVSMGGNVITFGYNSVSMGKNRGFEQKEILLMSHGGAIHDTIAVVEKKVK